MSTTKIINRDGWKYEVVEDTGEIHSVVMYGRKVSLGDKVYSNGRYGARNGKAGIITRLFYFFEGKRTSDVIEVTFDDHSFPTDMKFEDLYFEQAQPATV